LAASQSAGLALASALEEATRAAATGLEATKQLMAQHGKAAAFREKTIGLQDAGATVAFLLVDALRAHVHSAES
jgi:dihydroxyacetone kinase-like protein